MADGAESPERSSFLSRACENCRLRKIRCDKSIPCSSCQTLGIACQAAARTKHRPRVVISSQYEKQIELIQERLRSIEKSVKDISRHATSSSPGTDLLASSAHDSPAAAITAFEGESSFGTQTLQASQAADLTVAKVLGNNPIHEVATALSSLKTSLRTHESSSRVHEAYLSAHAPRSELLDLTLPPVEFVVTVVRRIKASPPFTLACLAWRNNSDVEDLCQKIYFPTEPIPSGSITLMHGLLFLIIRDYMIFRDPVLAHLELASYKELCEKNFCLGLESYKTLAVPTLETVQALLLGAALAQDTSKISLCWTYISAAHTMCQTLGFHRKSFLKNDSFEVAETKRHAFWSVYMLDKNFSLTLGRSSNFQDYDIDAEFFTVSTNPQQRPWDTMILTSIKIATVQGKVYDKLYSASGSRAPHEQRLRTIDELSAELMKLRDDMISIDTSKAYYSSCLDGMIVCVNFVAYSILTVIYRAQSSIGSPMEISPRCFEAARLSLQSHLKCFALFNNSQFPNQDGYVNWVLLCPSFTPFVVVFTHAIATTDTADLALLQDTVRSLEAFKGVSRSAHRLYDVCKAFLPAAEALINSRQTLTGLHHHDDGSLVLPSVTGQQAQTAMPDSWPDEMPNFNSNDVDMSVLLSSWLGTNRPVMDMLNCDFTEPDLS